MSLVLVGLSAGLYAPISCSVICPNTKSGLTEEGYIRMVKRFAPQVLILILSMLIVAYSTFMPVKEFSYMEFLTHRLVLSIGVVLLGILAGYLVKNFMLVVILSTFVLGIYYLAFAFDVSGKFHSFFLAIYTNFLLFAAFANLLRCLKEWILSHD